MSRSRKTSQAAPPATRCAIYTRKSTEEGLEQEFNSLDAQREAGEAYVASQKAEGWVCLQDRYDDGGYSGADMERPAVKRLLADIEAGKVDCVVVYKVDRLSRSLLDFARIIETFEKRQVSFVSVTQQFNTTHSMGRLTLNILLSFAQFEREIIGERIRDKIAAQRRKGKWTGGTPVLGYDVDRSGASPKLVINAEEASRVRRIFDLYLKLGSLIPVVGELERRGWHNKTWVTKQGKRHEGKPFDKCTLHGLLTNPIYIGKVRHRGQVHDGEHEAIVRPEVFAEVQATLRHNGRAGGAEVRNKYGALLRGLLFCKSCGRAMVHTFSGKKNGRYRYYVCTHAIRKGWKNCPGPSLPAAEVERVVVDQVRRIAQDADLQTEVVAQAQQQTRAEMAALQVEQRDLERELARHHAEVRKLAMTGSSDAATTARIADLHDRIQRAECRKAELAAAVEALEKEHIDETDLASAFADFDGVWNALSPREQAKVLKLLVARVEYDAAESTVAVTFHPSGIKALGEEQKEEAAA